MQQASLDQLQQQLSSQVSASLREDIGTGDITAALIPEGRWIKGQVITRVPMVLAGRPWVEEVFRQVDDRIGLQWAAEDGEAIDPARDARVFEFEGPARSLLTAERTALNWLQTLAGIATRCQQLSQRIQHTRARLLDTRKTIPGLRLAEKYAIRCGGGANHRLGLYDAFLIKENHILACGSIAEAVARARRIAPGKPVEVEVEDSRELEQALAAGAEIIMLDEFPLEAMQQAVRQVDGRALLEASGNINEQTLVPIAETGVDYLSMGTLTKDLQAIDLSMRFCD